MNYCRLAKMISRNNYFIGWNSLFFVPNASTSSIVKGGRQRIVPLFVPTPYYIIAVAVAIWRELTHPTNVANLHAVIGAACLIDVHSFCSLVVCRSGTQDAT